MLPTLAAGLLIALALAAARCLALLGRASTLRIGARICEGAAEFARDASLRDVPLVLAAQFAALFAMENAEQFADGRLLGGSAWLGGPPGFAVLAHVVVGVAFTLLLGALGRSFAAFVASLVCETLEAILASLSRSAGRSSFADRSGALLARAQSPHVRQIGGRAPPLRPCAQA